MEETKQSTNLEQRPRKLSTLATYTRTKRKLESWSAPSVTALRVVALTSSQVAKNTGVISHQGQYKLGPSIDQS